MAESKQINEFDDVDFNPAQKKVIQRLGGHHLILRLKKGRWWFVPKPYVLVSSIEGPLWVFYGLGQIWLTHKKVKYIKDWSVRVPRLVSGRLLDLIDRLEPDIENFIDYCNDQGLTATLVIERKVIECHWTLRRTEKQEENKGAHRKPDINSKFNELAEKFVNMQLIEPAEI